MLQLRDNIAIICTLSPHNVHFYTPNFLSIIQTLTPTEPPLTTLHQAYSVFKEEGVFDMKAVFPDLLRADEGFFQSNKTGSSLVNTMREHSGSCNRKLLVIKLHTLAHYRHWLRKDLTFIPLNFREFD